MPKRDHGVPSEGFAEAITLQELRRLAGPRSFERGEDYFERGYVGKLAEYQGRITASVQGTQRYGVKLWVDGGRLHHDCTCPVGDEGAFCKHCVAVGLTWLAEHERPTKGQDKPKRRPLTLDDVRSYLASLSAETLADMLMEQALENERFRDHLLMRAATQRATTAHGPVDTQPVVIYG